MIGPMAIDWGQTAAAATALTIIGGVLLKVTVALTHLFTRQAQFLDDWEGEPARPGVAARPGVLERMTALEHRTTVLEEAHEEAIAMWKAIETGRLP